MWVLVIGGISALNLSSACRHDAPTNISPEARTEVLLEGGKSENVVVATADEYKEPEHRLGEALPNVLGADELELDVTNAAALEELTWKTLTDVEFKDVYVEELDAYYWKPTFGPAVNAMKGREVYITGYIIPVDYDENFYVLSRYPFANCFFCGGAGPESVVDLQFKSTNRMYKTDERLTFRGWLALNADDVYRMNYILEEAEEYE